MGKRAQAGALAAKPGAPAVKRSRRGASEDPGPASVKRRKARESVEDDAGADVAHRDESPHDEFGGSGEEESMEVAGERGASGSDQEGDSASGDEGDGGEDGSGSDGSDDEGGFLSGNKGVSFAKAFHKVMEEADKRIAKVRETAQGGGAAPILAGSKSLARAQQGEKEALEKARQLRAERLQMKQRGHERVPRKGADPEHDSREKALSKLATKGVVRLFNAIAKAQRAAPAEAAAKKATRSSFFKELRDQKSERMMAGVKPAMVARAGAAEQVVDDEGNAVGWDVLQEGGEMPGMVAGRKMKDWDASGPSKGKRSKEKAEVKDTLESLSEDSSDDDDEDAGGW
ncbi:unnamed protein product [Pedinophyceae sp. YPF-701]|nr:unnamed protein product [Pedinophyceae sp. YPF-701]